MAAPYLRNGLYFPCIVAKEEALVNPGSPIGLSCAQLTENAARLLKLSVV
jgi:hypothetical protein